MLHSHKAFRFEVASSTEATVLRLFGELDVDSIAQFAYELASVSSEETSEITFDLTRAQFISVQGFAAIGRHSRQFEKAVVCSTSALAERVLRILGFDALTFVQVEICPGSFEIEEIF